MTPRRAKTTRPSPDPPTVPDLVLAPELGAIILLEHALRVATDALLAQIPTLIDDFHRPRDEGPVVSLAHSICLRAAVLRDTLHSYRLAVREAATSHAPDDDLPF